MSLISLSAPRNWIYTLSPFLTGVVSVGQHGYPADTLVIMIFILFFTFPANLFIRGAEAIFSYKEDLLNPNKTSAEILDPKTHKRVWKYVFSYLLPFLVYLIIIDANQAALLSFFAFIFLSAFYAAPPIRAKTIPGLDSIWSAANFLSIGAFGFFLAGGVSIPNPVILAVLAWAAATHALEATQSMWIDQANGTKTVATHFKKEGAVLIATFLYSFAAITAFSFFSLPSILLGVTYLLITLKILQTKSSKRQNELFYNFKKLNRAVLIIVPIIVALANLA